MQDEQEVFINVATGENEDNYHAEIQQPKDSKGFVLIVTAHGTEDFQQRLLDVLKTFDFDDDNSISVQDIKGSNVLNPDYTIPEEFVSKTEDLRN